MRRNDPNGADDVAASSAARVTAPKLFAPRLVHVLTVPLSLRFLRGQCQYFRERGFEVHVVCAGGADLDSFAREEGVHAHPLPLNRRITPLRDSCNLARLVVLLRSLRPTIVHGHTPKGGLLATLAGLIANVPVRLYHLRGLPLETSTGARRVLLTATERVTCACATEVIAVSDSLRRSALSHRLCSPQRIRVLRAGSGNGVDSVRFSRSRLEQDALSALRSRLNLPVGDSVLGFVGRLTADKGLLPLLEAWASLRARIPNAHLLIVGSEDGTDPLPQHCRDALERDPRIHHVPFTEPVDLLYGVMDVLALPSAREGFPNAVLEAAGMGVPAVVLRVTGSVDSVVDGETGRVVAPGKTEELVEAIAAYLENPELRARHGQRARARVESEFAPVPIWEALASRYAALRARPRQRGAARVIKRVLDLTLAGLFLVGTAPLHAAAALALISAQGRPVLFTQARVGHHGQVFELRKLRTMSDARGTDGALLPDEARLGRVGGFVRSLSLDELPQLWNVLLGDMSLVGPRPLLVGYLGRYSAEQARRHEVMPGLTGWAVVNGRNSTSWAERLALDTWYVDHWSLLLDIEILLRTALTVLGRRGVTSPGHVTMPEFSGGTESHP